MWRPLVCTALLGGGPVPVLSLQREGRCSDQALFCKHRTLRKHMPEGPSRKRWQRREQSPGTPLPHLLPCISACSQTSSPSRASCPWREGATWGWLRLRWPQQGLQGQAARGPACLLCATPLPPFPWDAVSPGSSSFHGTQNPPGPAQASAARTRDRVSRVSQTPFNKLCSLQ